MNFNNRNRGMSHQISNDSLIQDKQNINPNISYN